MSSGLKHMLPVTTLFSVRNNEIDHQRRPHNALWRPNRLTTNGENDKEIRDFLSDWRAILEVGN